MNDKEWQLVPRAITEEMIAAGLALGIEGIDEDDIEHIVTAALSAAPQPPEPGRLSGERKALAERTAYDEWDHSHHYKYMPPWIVWSAAWKAARAAAGSDEGAAAKTAPLPPIDVTALVEALKTPSPELVDALEHADYVKRCKDVSVGNYGAAGSDEGAVGHHHYQSQHHDPLRAEARAVAAELRELASHPEDRSGLALLVLTCRLDAAAGGAGT